MMRAAYFSEEVMSENLHINVMLLDHVEYSTISFCLTAATVKRLIFKKYQNLTAVLSEKQVNKLSAYESQDHEINTEEKQSPFKSIYNSFIAKLQTLCHYININLENKFIHKS